MQKTDISYARHIKKVRAEIKRDLKNKKIHLNNLLNDDYYWKYLKNMKLFDIIISLPGYGGVKTRSVMKKLKINDCKRISGLGSRQKYVFKKYFNIIF